MPATHPASTAQLAANFLATSDQGNDICPTVDDHRFKVLAESSQHRAYECTECGYGVVEDYA